MGKKANPVGLVLALLIGAGLAMPAPASAGGAVIRAYKRDPLPIYDDSGAKVGALSRKELPDPGKQGVPVAGAKDGFVAIMLAGKLTWLRKFTVDVQGDAKAVQCDKMAMQFAKMEQDGIDQSLGLGCAY